MDENYTPQVRFLSDGKDANVDRLSPQQRTLENPPRIVVPNDEGLKYDILLEAHDAPVSGHLGREKTYQAVSPTFWWPRMYKWVAHYVKTCERCQRVKPSGHAPAPLQSLPVPADCWKSMSLDFVFGLPADDKGNTGILEFVCRLSKMVHLAPVRDKVTGKQAAQLFLDSVFRYHGLPETIVSDRDPRFTGAFWDTLFQLLGTKLTMSTADDPQTDGQTERVNRVLEDTLRSICAEAPRSWSDQLPMVAFALNNAVHASTGFTPFYLNGLRHHQMPLTLRGGTVVSIKLKHRFIGPFAVLARHGAAYTIALPKSMATHPTFYEGRLKRYYDPLGPPSRTEEDQGESSPPRNEAEFSGQPKLPVSKPVNGTQAGTHASHTKGMTVPNGKSSRKIHIRKPSGMSTPASQKRASDHAPHGLERLSLDGVGTRNSAVNAPMELMSLTTKSVQVLAKDLKGPRLASLSGSLTTRSKPKGYLDRIDAISKLTDLVT
ncbi:reverse transcriptase [Phytophthora palmivora]|uniref:Reverse transcriptase n=1 Tax=Phytophthora palmivora TaxID=4796 RepID=A0A2P4X7W1_9STRA|nr:reverse transcriptase [Phytophthora palmivora]